MEAAPLTGGLRFELAGANAPERSNKPKTPWGNRKKLEDRKKKRGRRPA
jgi:hypothetical protein